MRSLSLLNLKRVKDQSDLIYASAKCSQQSLNQHPGSDVNDVKIFVCNSIELLSHERETFEEFINCVKSF